MTSFEKVYKGSTDIVVDVLSTGQSFGDIELIHSQPSRVTIRTLTYVELVCVGRDDFEKVLETSEFHAQEVAEMRANPKDHEVRDAGAHFPSILKEFSGVSSFLRLCFSGFSDISWLRKQNGERVHTSHLRSRHKSITGTPSKGNQAWILRMIPTWAYSTHIPGFVGYGP